MHKSTPKYLLVEKYIKKSIKNKTITDKLPGERTLAKELGFSYMTIRKAVGNLVTQGILYKIPTKGTFVADKKTRKNKTLNIGYFLDSSILSGVSSPYYSLIFHALEKEAANHGYSLVYFSELTNGNNDDITAKLDGVIASCFPRVEHTILNIKQNIPVVVIDNASSDKTIPSVIIDNFNAVLDSFEHLYQLGHRRIAFMTGLEDSDVGKNRCAGYQSGLHKHGLEIDESLIFRGNYSFKSGLEGAAYFLSLANPPSAIMCANDSMALGAFRRLHHEGIKVPDEISILGFDDIEVASQIVPALTTVKAPVGQIAKTAVCMLDHLIRGEPLDNKHVALTAELIVRQTCAELKDSTVAA